MIDLTGTPEHVSRATEIRDRVALKRLEAQVLEEIEGGLETQAADEAIQDLQLAPLVFDKLRSVADASWWIAHARDFRQTHEDFLVELWGFLKEQFSPGRFCGEAIVEESASLEPRIVRAAATLLRRTTKRPTPDRDRVRALRGMPRDLAALMAVDATHLGPLWLGDLRWNVRGPDHAAEILELAGQSVPPEGELRTLASSADDRLHLLSHWLPGETPAAEIYEADVLEERVQRCSLEQWLRGLLEIAEPTRQVGILALRDLLDGQPDQLPQLGLRGVSREVWEQAEILPSPEVVAKLKKRGHKTFLIAAGGTTVAVHTEGLRYLSPSGATKAATFKGRPIDKATLNADGTYARLFDGSAFHRVSLRDGLVQSTPVTEYITGYAHLPDDLVLLASPGLLRLMAIDAPPWREIQRIATVDVPALPTSLLEGGGRHVFLPDALDALRAYTLVVSYQAGRLQLAGTFPGCAEAVRMAGQAHLVLMNGRPFEVMGLLLNGRRDALET